MSTESTKTIPFKKSTVRSTAGLSFGEIGVTKVNGQMVYAPEVVQSHGQRSETQRPEGGTKSREEVPVPNHTMAGGVNSTASGNVTRTA
ncbi:hypothetical protein F25303_9214 [Fusarium sp. NRRL 25303]|nr:hypothetical protein F25303_9214 [Fusarium sp. NRRL 25303]